MHSFIIDCLYGYVDLLTIGLLLGCVWYAIQLIRRPKSARWYSAGQQMKQQQWLFGDWQETVRNRVAPWLFTVAVCVYQFQIFFINSQYRDRLPGLYEYGTMVLDHLMILCLILKILFAARYSAGQLVSSFAALFVIRWVFMNNHDKWMMMALLIALAAKDVPLRRALKHCFAVALSSVSVVAVSSLLGIIGTVQNQETARCRNSFGYGWYNYFGACLLAIALMYLCLRQIHRLKWFDFAFLGALALLCNFGPDSRAATVCLVLLLVGAALLRVWPKLLTVLPMRILAAASPLVLFALSMGLTLAWDPANGLMVKLNHLLSGRLELGWQALGEMPFRIAGQMPSETMLVDNAYVHYWLLAGPVVSVMIWLAMGLLIWKLLKQQKNTEAVCCLVMLCHAMMETHIMWACVNLAWWLMAGVIFGMKKQPDFACEKVNRKRSE